MKFPTGISQTIEHKFKPWYRFPLWSKAISEMELILKLYFNNTSMNEQLFSNVVKEGFVWW